MNLFSERKFISAKTGKGLKYLYYSPNTDGNLPLIIYLHGAGSRGTELSQLSHAGPIGELEKGRNIPARMVAPQCCGDTWFELFETLIDFADMFAALVPVCGGGMYWNAARLKNIPIRAFHGALDTTVLPEESVHMVAAVNNSGGKAELTVYPDMAHNSWERAFADDEMWKWMLSQKRG